MPKQYVMTITAANRVGILAAVSNAIAELGGDMQEVSVTVMRNFFTIILCSEFPEHRESQVIVDHIRDIGRPYGLEVVLKDPETDTSPANSANLGEVHILRVTGRNQPGMMRQIASRLAQDGVDIADLYANRHDDGNFEMVLEVSLPSGCSTDSLLAAINEIGERDGVTACLTSRTDLGDLQSPHSLRSITADANRDAG